MKQIHYKVTARHSSGSVVTRHLHAPSRTAVYKMMEASKFIGLAEPDRSTTLDRIGDIIGTGCTPGVEPDKVEYNTVDAE